MYVKKGASWEKTYEKSSDALYEEDRNEWYLWNNFYLSLQQLYACPSNQDDVSKFSFDNKKKSYIFDRKTNNESIVSKGLIDKDGFNSTINWDSIEVKVGIIYGDTKTINTVIAKNGDLTYTTNVEYVEQGTILFELPELD